MYSNRKLKLASITISLVILLILNSCDSGTSREELNDSTQSDITFCLNHTLSDYSLFCDNFELKLETDLTLTDSPKAYAEAYKNLYVDSLAQDIDLNAINSQQLFDFKSKIGVPVLIYDCTKDQSTYNNLTPNQRSFYKSFNKSVRQGVINNVSLSVELDKMTSEEFLQNGIKKVALYYLIYLLSKEVSYDLKLEN